MRNTRQRREQILQMLLKQGNVDVTPLASQFGVSTVTIRTDLRQIQAQGLARRTHGGASMHRVPPQEKDIHDKDNLNPALKQSIGARAAQLVNSGDNIIIDSGSTTMTLARHLHAHRDVTVMTNGLNVAWELAGSPGIELLLTGGVLRKQALSLQGAQAEACLGAYSFDTVFLGADGIDLQFGLTTHHEAEASLNHRMVNRARRVVVLADASKFGRISLHRICLLQDVHTVITDSSISTDFLDGLQRLGIEVIIAD